MHFGEGKSSVKTRRKGKSSCKWIGARHICLAVPFTGQQHSLPRLLLKPHCKGFSWGSILCVHGSCVSSYSWITCPRACSASLLAGGCSGSSRVLPGRLILGWAMGRVPWELCCVSLGSCSREGAGQAREYRAWGQLRPPGVPVCLCRRTAGESVQMPAGVGLSLEGPYAGSVAELPASQY